MACVLTVVVVDDGRAVVGHVGDTRLYKLRGGAIEKVTRDHSPVGEREDAREISELDAMRHPRRNEVYRDVGSEPHAALDPDFIDLFEMPFEPDAALLLCSDGLTDLVGSSAINEIARHLAGRPHEVVNELIKTATTRAARTTSPSSTSRESSSPRMATPAPARRKRTNASTSRRTAARDHRAPERRTRLPTVVRGVRVGSCGRRLSCCWR